MSFSSWSKLDNRTKVLSGLSIMPGGPLAGLGISPPIFRLPTAASLSTESFGPKTNVATVGVSPNMVAEAAASGAAVATPTSDGKGVMATRFSREDFARRGSSAPGAPADSPTRERPTFAEGRAEPAPEYTDEDEEALPQEVAQVDTEKPVYPVESKSSPGQVVTAGDAKAITAIAMAKPKGALEVGKLVPWIAGALVIWVLVR